MNRRVAPVVGAGLLGLSGASVLFTPTLFAEPVAMVRFALFGLGGALLLASAVELPRVGRHQLVGLGEVCLALALLAMTLSGVYRFDEWWLGPALGLFTALPLLWIGLRRTLSVHEAGLEWGW
ncbi:hypothetical protein [Haloarchaeobius sp. TZWWS8]|uniref:hypothetical protein n=1 Tax=Haloarchaeobius sp. TZWWS8 TaxID=3446121 RepID=UPI003EB8061A